MKRYLCKGLHRLLMVVAVLSPSHLGTLLAQEDVVTGGSRDSLRLSHAALEALAEEVQQFVTDGRIVGAELLVIENRRTVLHRAFGWNDRERGRAMERNTIFNIRSMTKPLVGAGIQILVDRGSLRLTDRVADHLPTLRGGRAAEVTIEQLLTHRGGLPVAGVAALEGRYENLQDAVIALAERGPQPEPGTRFWYSDAGADVLAAIIEIVSGESLEEFLETQLFKPLAMEDAGFHTQTSAGSLPLERIATLYGGASGAWHRFWGPSEEPLYRFPMGSQGVYCTPRDYARFLSLWLDSGRVSGQQLLTPEAVERMLTPVAPMTQIGSSASYPTGFPGLRPWHGQMALIYRDSREGSGLRDHVIGYAGSDGTYAWAWPERDVMVLLFSQSRGQDVSIHLEATLHALLNGRDQAGGGASPPSGRLGRYTGRYRADFGVFDEVDFTVLVQDDVLNVDIPGQGVFSLQEPDPQGWWSFAVTDLVAVSFSEDSLGQVKSMVLRQTTVLPKQGTQPANDMAAGDSIEAILGDYTLPAGQGALTISRRHGELVLRDPGGREVILGNPDECGWWQWGENAARQITFTLNSAGEVVAMRLEETEVLPRVVSPDAARDCDGSRSKGGTVCRS